MEAILRDLNAAYDKLKVELSKVDAQLNDIKKTQELLDKKSTDLSVRENKVSELEKKYQEFVSVESYRDKLREERTVVAKEKSSLESEKSSLANAVEQFKKDRIELDASIQLYKQKKANVDALKITVEEERKGLEKKIVEQFTKNLTKG
jgi:chromosome segregation ATPase